MPNIFELGEQFRAELLRRDVQSRAIVVRAYLPILDDLQKRLNLLMQQIREAQERGDVISPAWLLRQERFQVLIAQATGQIQKYMTGSVLAYLSKAQREAVKTAIRQAGLLLDTAVQDAPFDVSFNRLPAEAVEQFVGFSAKGTPLEKVFSRYGQGMGRMLKQSIVVGIAEGRNLRVIGREASKILERPRWEAERIIRTETLRAYRAATLETYRQNADIVTGWRWNSARQTRTCAACWALDGRVFPVDTPFAEHPNGRCFATPELRLFPQERETGPEAFRQLSAREQNLILGGTEDRLSAKYLAYKNGEFDLPELVGFRNDPQWGPTRYEKSLTDVLAGKRKRKP